jgi:hypothetical protein
VIDHCALIGLQASSTRMKWNVGEIGELFAKRLAELAGFKVSRPKRKDEGVDFTLERGDELFAVQVKASPDVRTPILRSFLAEAILEAQSRHPSGTRPLPIIAAPSISDRMATLLREFVHRVAPTQAWGLVDGRGRLEIFDGSRALVSLAPRDPRADLFTRVARRPALFSDVYQWLLKVLLATDLPAELLRAPRPDRIVSNRDLARVADVSLGSAALFLSAFAREGFVERTRAGLLVVRRRELLDAWRVAARSRSVPVGMRWVIAPDDPIQALARTIGQLREQSVAAAVGLHAACELLGHGFVRGVQPTLYVERFDRSALNKLGLTVAEGARAPDVFVNVPLAPRSCFSGCVERNGAQVTDVIQCWLDTAWHPARGEEQAQLLWDEVIEPRLVRAEVTA